MAGTSPGCPYCGAPLKDGVVECIYCGKSIQRLTTVEQKKSRLSKLAHEIGRRPPSLAQMLELGELTLGIGHNAKAVEYLRAVIKQDENDPHPRLLLCLALLGFNQPRVESGVHAREIGRHIAWLKEHHPDLIATRWLTVYLEMQRFSRNGDWARGVALGKKALEEFPDNYLIHSMLAAAYLRYGRTEGLTKVDYQMALRHMRIAAELNPDYTPAVRNVMALERIIAKMSKEK